MGRDILAQSVLTTLGVPVDVLLGPLPGDPQRRARSRERRMVALYAIRRIYEKALREKIIKLVGLW